MIYTFGMRCDLPFASIELIRDDLAEVIVYEGVEMTLPMVEEYHACLIENLSAPFSLLINRLHSYSYSFDAQQAIGNIPQIHCIAVVVYSEAQSIAMNVLDKGVPREEPWNMRVFHNREMALDWLIKQQGTVE